MLMLSRQKHQQVLVGPVLLTITRIGDGEVDVSVLKPGQTEPARYTITPDTRLSIGPCKVTLEQIGSLNCKLGFDAPKHIDIFRREIHDTFSNPGKRRHVA